MIPPTKLNAPSTRGLDFLSVESGATALIGGGVEVPCSGASPVGAADGAGASRWMVNLLAVTGGGAVLVTRGGGGLEKLCANMPFAVAVPSALQTGQFTVNGMRPLTGSTSNLNFWPH